MKEYKRRRSLSGAVLIMILTVMFVLIILLTATLTTVTTANQRIYTKFEENQAYYTARSALDVFTMNMLDDGNYVTTIDYDYTKPDGTNDTVPMKQGLALQLDLYMLKPQSGFQSVDQNDLKTFVTNTTDTKLKLKQYEKCYGTDSAKVITGADGKEYVEYEVELPQLEDGSNKYGKLSDKESNIPKAKIKVELLERTYDIGSYDISSYTDKEDFFENGSASDKAEAVVSGNRENDTMRVKITATTTFDGVDGIAVLILDNTKPVVPSGTRAITVLGTTYSLFDITVIGGISSPVDTVADHAISIGDTFVGKKLNVTGTNGSEFYFNNSECLYIEEDVVYQNNLKFVANETPASANERPFVYIGGNFTIGSNLGGLTSAGVDLVVNGNLTVTGDGTLTSFNGNIFVNGTIDISGAGDHTQVVNGTVYSPSPIIYNAGDSGSVPFTSTSTASFTIDDQTSTGGEKKLLLPDGSQRNLPYKEDIYSEHYEGGNINDPSKMFTAEDLAFVSKDDRENGMHTTNTFKALADSLTDTNKLLNSNGNWYFGDWTSRPDNKLTSGTYYVPYGVSNGWFNLDVVGGGTVELILGAGTYSGSVTVDDDTTLKIYSYDENCTYNFQNFSIVNKGISTRITNGDNIYVGQYGDDLIAPTISFFFSKGCKMTDDGSGDFFTAYIQSPQAEVELRQGHSVANVYYNNVPVGTQKVNILGSVLCGNLNTLNQAGVAYVNPNVPSVDAGEPIHTFESFQYVRS